MPKLKKMANTKQQEKYLRPYTVSRITESHAFIPNPKGMKKDKKVPIDIVLHYYQRDAVPDWRTVSRKRKSENSNEQPANKRIQLVYFNSNSFDVIE